MWYKIDYNILSIQLLPTQLRKLKLVAYISVLIAPIIDLYDKWLLNRDTNLYKLAHTGQVCFLRKVLNDEFDPQLRRIRLTNGNKFERLYIYTSAELKPQYLGTMYLRPRTDYADTGVDFIVYAPTELLDSTNYRMKALIDFYREGIKRYKIEGE